MHVKIISVFCRDARGSLFLLWGGVVEPGAFSGWGGAFLKIFGAGAPEGSHFPRGRGGAGRGGAGGAVHPCLRLTHGYCEGTFGANKTGQFEEEELHTCRQTLL